MGKATTDRAALVDMLSAACRPLQAFCGRGDTPMVLAVSNHNNGLRAVLKDSRDGESFVCADIYPCAGEAGVYNAMQRIMQGAPAKTITGDLRSFSVVVE